MNDSTLRVVPTEPSLDTGPRRAEAPEIATPPILRSRRRLSRSALIKSIAAVAVAIVLSVLLWQWLVERWAHVSVDDARIGADLISVSSAVSDVVTEVPISAGDRVEDNQLLIGIDKSKSELAVKELDADLAGIDAQQAQLRAQEDLTRSELLNKTDVAEAQLAGAEADQVSANATLANAKAVFQRVSALRDRQVTAAQDFDQAQATFIQAQQQELHAEAGVRTAQSNVAEAAAERAQIAVLEKQIQGLDAQRAAKQAQRGEALVDIQQREIRAAFAGVIDATFIHPGEFAMPGQRLFIYHDPRVVWVDANVKETDIRDVKIGAPVAVTVDAYPGQVFHGHVAAVGDATSSQFALLPSPNPSGNFTKVTQRLPIKIAVEQRDNLLRPGMMVEASIDVVR